jgi:hypothetical protein
MHAEVHEQEAELKHNRDDALLSLPIPLDDLQSVWAHDRTRWHTTP